MNSPIKGVHTKDQMLTILKVLGHQSSKNLEFIDNKKGYIHAKDLNKFQTKGNNLHEMLAGTSPALIELIKDLLLFNPNERHSAR